MNSTGLGTSELTRFLPAEVLEGALSHVQGSRAQYPVHSTVSSGPIFDECWLWERLSLSLLSSLAAMEP
jgi:hypothetical protein